VLFQKIQRIDRELFLRLSKGDEDAFRQLADFYNRQLVPVSVSLVASEAVALDIMQEVLLKLWLSRDKLAVIEHPFAWLKTVVANATTNHYRSQLNYELRNQQVAAGVEQSVDPQQEMDLRATQAMIDEAVEQLSQQRKEVFVLSRRHGLARKEIAQRLNLSENTVRNHLSDAVSQVASYLKNKGIAILPVLLVLKEM
jgi:RNA polymerase sigma-70 factor (family 1)